MCYNNLAKIRRDIMQKYFELIVDIGEKMLVSGAEVHRVEDSIERMCGAVGFLRTDVFIITSCMYVTVYSDEGNYTQIRRIREMRTDMEKLHRLNALSREICATHPTREEAAAKFDEIKSLKHISFWTDGLANVIIAGGFTLFFGGTLVEALVSALMGFLLCNLVYLLGRAKLNRIFSKFLGAFFVALGAYGAMKLGIIGGMDKVIIGNIMLLVPGVVFTNGFRDLMVGDSISGWLRLTEALLLTLGMAAGYVVFMFIVGGVAV